MEGLTTARAIVSLVLCAAGLYLLYSAYEVVLTGIIGIGIGILLAPLLSYLHRRFRFPRSISALVVLAVLLLLLAGFFLMLGQLASAQFLKLSASAPQILQNLKGRLLSVSDQYPVVFNQIQALNFQDAFSSSVDRVFNGLKSGVFAISSLAIALFLGLYTAVDSEEYFEAMLSVFPPSSRGRARAIGVKCAQVLRVWFRAQLIDMGIIGLSMGVVLWIVGMEYWAVFALLTAVLCIIPYAGIIIVILLASIVTLASQPDRVLWVVLSIFFVQQIEANIVLPGVMRDQAQLPEVPLLIFMLMMGCWFGLVGVFVAPALFAILKTLYAELYQPWLVRVDAQNKTSQINTALKP